MLTHARSRWFKTTSQKKTWWWDVAIETKWKEKNEKNGRDGETWWSGKERRRKEERNEGQNNMARNWRLTDPFFTPSESLQSYPPVTYSFTFQPYATVVLLLPYPTFYFTILSYPIYHYLSYIVLLLTVIVTTLWLCIRSTSLQSATTAAAVLLGFKSV